MRGQGAPTAHFSGKGNFKKKYSSPNRKKIAADKKRRQTISGMSQTLAAALAFFLYFLFQFRFYFFPSAGKGERVASGSALQ